MANIPKKSRIRPKTHCTPFRKHSSPASPSERSAPVTPPADIAQDPAAADLFNEPQPGDWDPERAPARRRQ